MEQRSACGSRANPISLRTSLLLVFLIASVGVVRAEDVCRGRAEPMAQAIRFMQAIHKDLMVEGAGLRVEGQQDFGVRTLPFFGNFVLQVFHHSVEPPNPSHPAQHLNVFRTVASGEFWFYVDCTPMKYAKTLIHGEPPDRGERLREIVDLHPEWDDARILKELKDAGARYTPDQRDAFMKTFPIGPLEGLLGRIKIVHAEFKTAHQGNEGHDAAHLDWEIDVTAAADKEETEEYGLSFEPFDGTLQSITIDSKTWRRHARR